VRTPRPNGEEEPKRWLVIFWGVAQGAVASVLLWSGGDDLRSGLTALQNLVIIVGGVFMLVIIAMCVSLMKALRSEPDTTRRSSPTLTTIRTASTRLSACVVGCETCGRGSSTVATRAGCSTTTPTSSSARTSWGTPGRAFITRGAVGWGSEPLLRACMYRR
jgi:hypothetical protein